MIKSRNAVIRVPAFLLRHGKIKKEKGCSRHHHGYTPHEPVD
jgi:hypothetical protein